MHAEYRNPTLRQLRDQQVRFAPREKKLEQADRAVLGLNRGHRDRMADLRPQWEAAIAAWDALLDDDVERGLVGRLRGMVRRLGEPVIRTAVARAMREMGRQFVLGETIGAAMRRAAAAMSARCETRMLGTGQIAISSDATLSPAPRWQIHHTPAKAVSRTVERPATSSSAVTSPGPSNSLSCARSASVSGRLRRSMAPSRPFSDSASSRRPTSASTE